MDKLVIRLVLLIHLICMLDGKLIMFSNITCESKDLSVAKVEYCYVHQVSHVKNYMSLRYSMFKPVVNGVIFHGKFMIYRNGWRSFLYSIKMDMCKFMELRYNALAKLIFGLTDGKTNINHTCPYNNEKYIAMDEIMSTDLSMRLGGIPLGKGQYGFFTRWIWQNATKVETNIFFNVVRD